MKAEYLVRLDDACPAMDIGKWERIGSLLEKHAIKPIAAVIPHCEDAALNVRNPVADFWGRVKKWESNGWAIALHGYNHVCAAQDGGLISINKESEFAGLPFEKQAEKIGLGYKIFLDNGIKPRIFVAPFHSLDEQTLKALGKETDIRIVSDGLAVRPYVFLGFKWMPQQLWRFRRMPFGLWTICLHPSAMEEKDFRELENDIAANKDKFISAGDVFFRKTDRDIADYFFVFLFRTRQILRGLIK